MMNKEGFSTSDGFVGSVKDYFLAQSDGRFDLTFDVKGPYMMPSNYEYYGNNYEEKTVDVVNECLKQAHNEGVNMAQYDWYNNGDVDLVYVIYAGYGQATSTDKSSIWPHASRRTTAFAEYDGKELKQYACSNEIDQIKDNDPNALEQSAMSSLIVSASPTITTSTILALTAWVHGTSCAQAATTKTLSALPTTQPTRNGWQDGSHPLSWALRTSR